MASSWKKLLSYVADVHLESLESEHNEELHVLLSRGRYQLCTANAIYSFDDLYVNFQQAFKALDITERGPERVLVLGLGLGSIPFMLEKKFDVKADYTAVEIDETIIYLAGKYSLKEFKSPIQYVCSPAEVFVQCDKSQYDLVCVDVFQDDVVPDGIQSSWFLRRVSEMLRPGGVLLFNRLSLLPKDVAETRAYFNTVFKAVFPEGDVVDAKGNWVLVGEKPVS